MTDFPGLVPDQFPGSPGGEPAFIPLNLLALSNINGDPSALAANTLPSADLVVLAGNLTTQGLKDLAVMKTIQDWVNTLVNKYGEFKVLWIPGPNDYDMKYVVFPGAVNLAQKPAGYNVAGRVFYGVPITYSATPTGALQYETNNTDVEQAFYRAIQTRVDILVTNASYSSPRLSSYLADSSVSLHISGHPTDTQGLTSIDSSLNSLVARAPATVAI